MACVSLLDHFSALAEPRFPGLKAIAAMVEATVERRGTVSTARRYFLCSMAIDDSTLARAARAHWGTENRLHWVLDAVFHDDLMRLRTKHGPKNMATHQAHGHEPHPQRTRRGQHEGAPQGRRLGPRLSPGAHHPCHAERVY